MFGINVINPPEKKEYTVKNNFVFPIFSIRIKQKWETILNRKIDEEVKDITISRDLYITNIQEIHNIYFGGIEDNKS